MLDKKAVEMGRYYTSEAMRKPKLQKKAIGYALDKLNPVVNKVGSEALNQLSTNIRPKKNYRTNRKDLDGAGLDIHKAIGKLPKPKRGWTLPGHNYTGPYNPLENQVKYDPVTGEILEIYQQLTGNTDAVAMRHDIDYSVCQNKGENVRQCKNKADKKWLNLWMQYHGIKGNGVILLLETKLIQNKNLVLVHFGLVNLPQSCLNQ